MTLDHAIYAFAQSRLAASGLSTYSVDAQRLAERIQDCVEDFEADLSNDYEEASHG